MKRALVVFTAVAVLAVPASASAGTKHYQGAVEGDANSTLHFDVKRKKGSKKKFAKEIFFEGINLNCSNGQQRSTVFLVMDGRARIRNGEFTKTGNAHQPFSAGGFDATITGRPTRSNATGTLHVSGAQPGSGFCDSGVVNYSIPRK